MRSTGTKAVAFMLMSLLGAVVTPAAAESVYIDDELRVGVRTEPDNSLAPVGVVTTGMKLEVIERVPGYMKIRTDAGLQGWIRDIYTTQTPPAILQLKQLKKEQARLRTRLAEQQRQQQRMEQKNLALFERNEQLEAQIDRLKVEVMKHRPMAVEPPAVPNWTNWLAVAAAVIIAGFALGIGWQRRRIIRRLGGLRV